MRDRIADSLRPLTDARGVVPTRPAHSDYDLNGGERPHRRLRSAAVLVPLVEHPGGLHVLLTRRSEHLKNHPGQISFPGGRLEEGDSDAIAAALRETQEEIGLDSHFIEPVGLLDEYETVTGFKVTPVVSFVRPGFNLVLDAFEVADAFEVPLRFIFDPRNHQTRSRVREGVQRRFFVFEYGKHYIWGATAAMLMNFYRRANSMAEHPVGHSADQRSG